MKTETFAGDNVTELLAEARAKIGPGAVLVKVHRLSGGRGFELVAGDPLAYADGGRRPRRRRASGPKRLPSRVTVEGLPGVTPLIIALVGPTGAGKTTTLAKLANHGAVFGERTVGFISLDTYRVGALEQLQAYADLSRIPFEVIYDRSEIFRTLRRLRGNDVILVDTPGRGPHRVDDSKAVRSLLRVIQPTEVHLTLPAGLNESRARRLIEDYREHGVTHLLPTKLDEYPEEETAFALAEELLLPMRWVSNGQRVPRNLQLAALWPRRLQGPRVGTPSQEAVTA